MLTRILLAFFVALSALTSHFAMHDAAAKPIHVGVRAGAAVTYGATLDAGETDDPLVDATAWNSSTSYRVGRLVSHGGAYYFATAASTNQQPPNTTYWWAISKFYYVDASASSGTCAGHTDPATAQSATNMCNSMVQVYDLTVTGGSVNAPRYALILLKRGDTYNGHFSLNNNDGSAHSLYLIGAWGARASARPVVQFSNNNGSFLTGTVFNNLRGGGIVRNIVIDGKNITYFSFTAGTGTFTAGDAVNANRTRITYTDVVGVLANGDSVTDTTTGATGVIDNRPSTPNGTAEIKTIVGTFGAGNTIQTSGGAKSATLLTTALATGSIYENPANGQITYVPVSGANPLQNDTLYTAGMAKTGTISLAPRYLIGVTLVNGQAENLEVRNCNGNGILVGTSLTPSSGDNAWVNNNIVHDSALVTANGAGIDQGIGNNITITNNTLYDNGNGSTTHNLYMQDLTNSLIANNWMYMTETPRGNHAVVIHGVVNGLTIRDNKMENNYNAIGVNDGYATAESFTNITIERNIITGTGQMSWQNGGGYGMLLAGLISSTIRNNYIGNNKLGGIWFYVGASGGGDTTANNVSVYHNTIDMPATTTPLFAINFGGALGAGFDVRNNILANRGTGSQAYAIQKSSSFTNSNLTLNNNLYYTPSFASALLWNGSNIANNITAIRTAVSGTTGAEAAGNYGNPLWVNAATFDYRIQVGSAADGLGASGTGVTTDFRQLPRDGSAPSAGAYE